MCVTEGGTRVTMRRASTVLKIFHFSNLRANALGLGCFALWAGEVLLQVVHGRDFCKY